MSLVSLTPRALLVAAATSLCVAATASAQEVERNAFSYEAALRAGRTVHVHNVNGAITVERTSGSRVEIRAEKRWRRGDPDDVQIARVEGPGGDIVVCALWNDAECSASGIRSQRKQNWNNRNDVSVHFTVLVPDGVNVDVNSVNGEVNVDGVSGTVEANTVNGSVVAESTRGPVSAKTVNGSIRASLGSMGDDDLRYTTVNGSITLELPSRVDADLDISTVNGRVNTDFPVTVQGSISRKRLRGTIGDGGHALKASTVNGSVTLKRAG
jgi:hypothetical protein